VTVPSKEHFEALAKGPLTWGIRTGSGHTFAVVRLDTEKQAVYIKSPDGKLHGAVVELKEL